MICYEETVWSKLKSLIDPKLGNDIVGSGTVLDVAVVEGKAMVKLAKPVTEAFEHQALAGAIERELSGLEGIEKVSVTWEKPEQQRESFVDHGRDGVSLNVLSEADTAMGHGVAEEIGYGEFGPDPITSPEAEIPDAPWEGYPPVLQWDIDPMDATIESGESTVQLLDWHFEIWWQRHPSNLRYVAIQAMHEDGMTEEQERQHPVGRNVVVNLVYDEERNAVVSVYGTARDFRPFIEAFQIGCEIQLPEGVEQVTTTAPKTVTEQESNE
ncbi:MAG: iron-sulfur cluster assembly protein [Phycisphaerales bacterium]|jgi:metal-sulfur cluster biosynthetic enzyme|nr:iron-sulfur cluster assembly protein [Phycisphaerales bacterium]